jgi:hypothetical protein
MVTIGTSEKLMGNWYTFNNIRLPSIAEAKSIPYFRALSASGEKSVGTMMSFMSVVFSNLAAEKISTHDVAHNDQ